MKECGDDVKEERSGEGWRWKGASEGCNWPREVERGSRCWLPTVASISVYSYRPLPHYFLTFSRSNRHIVMFLHPFVHRCFAFGILYKCRHTYPHMRCCVCVTTHLSNQAKHWRPSLSISHLLPLKIWCSDDFLPILTVPSLIFLPSSHSFWCISF